MKKIINKLGTIQLLSIFILCSTSAFAQSDSDAILAIYCETEGNRTPQGTGFYISSNGRIMTAYHVIIGAKKIWVNDINGNFTDDVIVESISPIYDLAILRLGMEKKVTVPYLLFSDYNFNPSQENRVKVLGWPRGMPNFQFHGNILHNGYLNSHLVKDENGKRLFLSEIDLIMIGIEAYNGISGGPLICNGKVIGVINGSRLEEEQMAWAIPVKYRNSLQRIDKKPSQITLWPSFAMISGFNYNELRNWYSYNPIGESLYDSFKDLQSKLIALNYSSVQNARNLRYNISKFLSLWDDYYLYYTNKSSLTASQINEIDLLEKRINQQMNMFDEYNNSLNNYFFDKIMRITKNIMNINYDGDINEYNRRIENKVNSVVLLVDKLEKEVSNYITASERRIYFMNEVTKFAKMANDRYGTYTFESAVENMLINDKQRYLIVDELCRNIVSGDSYVDSFINLSNDFSFIFEVKIFN